MRFLSALTQHARLKNSGAYIMHYLLLLFEHVRTRHRSLVICTLLFLLLGMTVWWYWASLSYPFEFDDLPNIVKYFSVRSATLRDLCFSKSRWVSHWLNTLYYAWSPVSNKFNPFLYRLGNIVIHGVTGILVFCSLMLIKQYTKKHTVVQQHGDIMAYLATGIFLLHPVQTQTVSYVIQGQLEGLACCSVMAMVCCLLSYAAVAHRWLKALCVCLLLSIATIACGVKEIVIVAPALLLFVDYFFVAHGSWTSLRSRWWLHALVGVIIIGWYCYYLNPTFFTQVFGFRLSAANNIGNVLTESRDQRITPWLFLISQGKVILHYLWIFLWPFGMSVDYDWKLCRSAWSLDCMVPWLCLILLGVYIIVRLRRNRIDLISFCFLWFFVSLAPRSSIIPATELMADYKTYIGSYAIAVLGALGLLFCFQRMQRYGFLLASWQRWLSATLLLCTFGFAAYQRNKVWETPASFWLNIIKNAPQRARAYNNYGTALCEENRHAESVAYFKYAISLDNLYPDPWTNLSVAYTALNRIDDAIYAATRGLRITPHHVEGHNNLASLLIIKERLDDAEKHARIALQLRPYYGKAHMNIGKIALLRNQLEEAWDEFRKSCMEGDFDTAVGFYLYGDMSFKLNKFDHAIIAYTKLLMIDASQTHEPHAVRRVFAALKLQRYEEAEHWAQEWLHRFPTSVNMLITLGDVLFNQKNYPLADMYYERALFLCPTQHYAAYYSALCAEHMGDIKRAYKTANTLLSSCDKKDKWYRCTQDVVQRLQQRLQ
jgi:tetratricopeptide (TPR) repeat protein